jgi:hypothetical protein
MSSISKVEILKLVLVSLISTSRGVATDKYKSLLMDIIRSVTKNGIAVVTFDYTTVSPDINEKTGASWALYNRKDIDSSSLPFPHAFSSLPLLGLHGQQPTNKWKGVLITWAWGFPRVLDALIFTAPKIDRTKVGVTDYFCLGKAPLAASLFDTCISVTIAMSSGIQGLGPYHYTTLSHQGENLENSKLEAGWWSNSVLGTFGSAAVWCAYYCYGVGAESAGYWSRDWKSIYE